MQTKKLALIETIVGVITGFIISFILTATVFPLFDINISIETNLKVTIIFTIVSIVRGYTLRRIFNRIAIREMAKK